jgi:hypothetical protein
MSTILILMDRAQNCSRRLAERQATAQVECIHQPANWGSRSRSGLTRFPQSATTLRSGEIQTTNPISHDWDGLGGIGWVNEQFDSNVEHDDHHILDLKWPSTWTSRSSYRGAVVPVLHLCQRQQHKQNTAEQQGYTVTDTETDWCFTVISAYKQLQEELHKIQYGM